ncbi:hypothetical protein CRP01_05020 [Flavilitoribacter nigricans DSM 23189 = NBRC 102662]|uniref:Uncharacterized protein n=1 Tax=Flavilitoribacter nigricans (strain ATCC 23147 / DSM 23189 / NBRC 102662 / NCIMB 1420 / SS-2) TaxID=1122177 RepID=A0A2D0NGF5_FLAN2|nr:hypothetical protein CRP01_05020 [Flavilitoribacter nigricans DSM 23189 = NBRC 102662]
MKNILDGALHLGKSVPSWAGDMTVRCTYYYRVASWSNDMKNLQGGALHLRKAVPYCFVAMTACCTYYGAIVGKRRCSAPYYFQPKGMKIATATA